MGHPATTVRFSKCRMVVNQYLAIRQLFLQPKTMADVPTIAASVVLSLTVQGAYYVFMKFPGQLRKNVATLNQLKAREDSGYAVYKNVIEEIGLAAPKFDAWKLQLTVCKNRADGELIDRAYFLTVLPELTTLLGRLRGLSSVFVPRYPTDLLPDFIWLLEQGRRISKTLASFENISEINLTFELSDIEMVEAKVRARLEQIPHEAEILQADTRIEIEHLAAEVSETRRRFLAATSFLGFVFALSSVLAFDKIMSHFKMQILENIGLSVGLSISVVFILSLIHISEPTRQAE